VWLGELAENRSYERVLQGRIARRTILRIGGNDARTSRRMGRPWSADPREEITILYQQDGITRSCSLKAFRKWAQQAVEEPPTGTEDDFRPPEIFLCLPPA
jgi:hypothetical protein